MIATNRRTLGLLALGGAIVATAASVTPANAYQGNMEHALSSLYAASAALRQATRADTGPLR